MRRVIGNVRIGGRMRAIPLILSAAVRFGRCRPNAGQDGGEGGRSWDAQKATHGGNHQLSHQISEAPSAVPPKAITPTALSPMAACGYPCFN